MKALSILQPWATLILWGAKRTENRKWRRAPTYRGPLVIHTGKGWHYGFESRDADGPMSPEEDLAVEVLDHIADGRDWKRLLPRGGLLGVVNLTDAAYYSDRPLGWWHEPGCLGLYLTDPQPFPELIPWRGQLAFFDVPDDVVDVPLPSNPQSQIQNPK